MLQFTLKRLLMTIPVLFGISLIVFTIVQLSPGDPALLMLGEGAPAEDLEILRRQLGYYDSLPVQYLRWLERAVIFDFGRSLRSRRLVSQEILDRLPATGELAGAAVLFAILAGVPIGVLSATRPNSFLDNIAMVGALTGLAMPAFWQGIMMILIFSVWLGWLPSSGRLGGAEYIVLPALTLGTSAMAGITRMTRTTMLETVGQDYIRTARAKGLAERVVVYRHALRNALIPVVTVIGLQLGALLAGAVITETVFAWPGIGRLAIDAIRQQDYPMIQGVVVTFAVSYALINLLVDLLYALLDPRLEARYG
jgi:peptide/nickel transport system permease protein